LTIHQQIDAIAAIDPERSIHNRKDDLDLEPYASRNELLSKARAVYGF
jgi:hypothetical protein